MAGFRVPKGIRIGFGIFMILLYLGMGILVFNDVFQMAYPWMKYVLGTVLVLYGLFRGYRQYKLGDYTSSSVEEDDEDEK